MENLYAQLAIEAVSILITGAATSAANRVRVKGLERRVGKLESHIENLPKDYVPRSEVELALKNISENTKQTNDMVHALFYSGGNREVALRTLEASAALMQYSAEGMALTEQSEELELTAYFDAVNVLTIGWGHTGPDVYLGMTITRDQAVELLHVDARAAEDCVNRCVHVAINQHEFDALVDFVFNEGTGHFESSTLLRELNAGNRAAAAAHFADWVMAGGRRLGGLVARRNAEEKLFLEA